MSTSLTLIPFGPSHAHSSTLLGPIEPTEALVEALEAIEEKHGRDVPLIFNTFRGHSNEWCRDVYGNTQENVDGSRLKHVGVSELFGGLHPDWTGEIDKSWLSLSALAYLSHLPKGWRVALYWH